MPPGVQDLVFGGGKLYLKTATSVLLVPNYYTPTTNSIYYDSTPPHSMAGTSDNSVLYVLDEYGDIINIRSSVVSKSYLPSISKVSIGSSRQSSINSVSFGNTENQITGTSLLSIHPGLWAVTIKWKFTPDNTGLGDGLAYVKYGLSHTTTGFELFSKYREYNYANGDFTSWEEFSDSFIVNIAYTNNFYLNAITSNDDPFIVPIGVIMTNCSIKAILIQ
jgi:hypothetical protein